MTHSCGLHEQILLLRTYQLTIITMGPCVLASFVWETTGMIEEVIIEVVRGVMSLHHRDSCNTWHGSKVVVACACSQQNSRAPNPLH